MMDGGFRERHLKDLLLVNLDLIQRQQELLSEKDKRIQHLQHENDTLKIRLDRIERRMSLCSQKQVQQQPSAASPQAQHAEHLKPADEQKSVAACDQVFENSGQSVDVVSKHGRQAQSNKLSENTGKRAVSFTKDSNSVRSAEQVQAAVGSLPSKASASKLKFSRDNSEILTTDKPYYSSVTHSVPENDLMDGAEVLVPSWRFNVVHSKYVMEGTENLNDGMFLKRHQKSELEEKRRKRWDMQRLRDLHLLQQQHQQNVSRSVDNRGQVEEPVSFMPSNDRVCYVDVDECIPVAVFGHALPQISSKQFELPWSDAPNTSELTVDSRKTKKRRRNK